MKRMDDLKRIVWLASYPKSGNTWFRAFLTALLYPENPTVDINNMYPTIIASSRQFFDEMAGVASSDLSPKEIDRLRPLVYRRNALESNEIIYHKVHDAYTLLPGDVPLFQADITKAVLYFIRNPLDVVVSFANHLNTTIEKTISIMNSLDYAFSFRTDRLHNQVRQKLLTWSEHVKSWVDESGLPLLVLRYEDMKANPILTFSRAVLFIGLSATRHEIELALCHSSFDNLKKQEEEKGFSEKSARSSIFFRKGIVGDWQNVLTKEQIERIIEQHGEMMYRFGYLSKEK